jgi:hypothetical protein
MNHSLIMNDNSRFDSPVPAQHGHEEGDGAEAQVKEKVDRRLPVRRDAARNGVERALRVVQTNAIMECQTVLILRSTPCAAMIILPRFSSAQLIRAMTTMPTRVAS